MAGCALFLLRVPLPALINDTLGTLGDMFGPLGMLLAGMVIADTPLRRLFTTPRNYLPALLRLLAFPLVTVLLLRAAGAAGWIADGKNILMIVYLACITPACATVTSLAQLYDRNAAYSSALYVVLDNAAFHRDYAGDDWSIRRADMRIWQEKAARKADTHKE